MTKLFAVFLIMFSLVLPAEPVLAAQTGSIQYENSLQETFGIIHSGIAARPLPPQLGQFEKLTQIFTFNVSLRLLWKPSVDAARYRLQIARDEAFQEILEEEVVAATQYDPQNKYSRGVYFWHVASIDAGGGQGPYSETLRFEYQPVPDPPDIGGTPVHFEEKTISFDLPALPQGERYQLVLARDPQLKDVVWRGEPVKLPLIVFKPEPGQYYLAAQAVNDEGMAGPFEVLPLEIK